MHRYKVIKELGIGSSGTANLVQEKHTKEMYVMKSISLENCDEAARLRVGREVSVLHSIDHPNVVQFKTCFSYANQCHIVMEKCEANLDEIIQRRNGEVFSTGLLVEWFTELLCSVAHIHQKQILHRDLKSSNIFLSKRNHLKLGDFGVCKTTASEELRSGSLVGTPQYLSPEVCEGERYTEKSDIWSLGIVFYELLAHDLPFKGNNILAVARDIMTEDPKPLPSGYDARFSDIVFAMLRRDPKQRPSAQQLLDKFFHLPASHPSHPSQKAQHGRKIMEKFGPELQLDPPGKPEDSDSDNDNDGMGLGASAFEEGDPVPGRKVRIAPPQQQENGSFSSSIKSGAGGSPAAVVGGPQKRGAAYKAPPGQSKVSSRWEGSTKPAPSSAVTGLNREGSYGNIAGMNSPEEHQSSLNRIKNAKSKVNVAEMKREMARRAREQNANQDTVHFSTGSPEMKQQSSSNSDGFGGTAQQQHSTPVKSPSRHVDPVTPEISPESRSVLAPQRGGSAGGKTAAASSHSTGAAHSSAATSAGGSSRPSTKAASGLSPRSNNNSNNNNSGQGKVNSNNNNKQSPRNVPKLPLNQQRLASPTTAATSNSNSATPSEAVIALLNARHEQGGLTMDDVDDLIMELNRFKVEKFALASM